MSVFEALWSYRGFVLASVGRDFRARYLNSLLGAGWAVLAPLAMILVYTLVFSQVMNARLPGVTSAYGYSIYLCAGVLTWNLFSEILSQSATMFIDHANLLKKLSFPRLCLPLIVIANSLVNFAVGIVLFILFLWMSGNFPGRVIWHLVPLLCLEIVFAASLGLVLGLVNVFFRDVGHFLRIGLQFWFWMTPIVYTVSLLPEALQPWLILNPMTGLITAFQQVLLSGVAPTVEMLWPMLVSTLLLLIFANRCYHRLGEDMVDEL